MRLNGIPACLDSQDIATKNWSAILDPDREARAVANAIVDFSNRPNLPLEVFHTGAHRAAWRRLQASKSAEMIPQDLRGAYEYLADPTQQAADVAYLAGKFVARNGVIPGAEFLNILRGSASEGGSLLDRLMACEIDVMNPPPPDSPIYYVKGILTGTTGNLGALIGRAKSGKTSVNQAHLAAAVVAAGLGVRTADTLGISSTDPRGKAVVVLDTEQSKGDACALVSNALRRAGLAPVQRPDWLRSFSFAGVRARDLTAGLAPLLEKVAEDHGGIHAFHIDGGADFASNVNDPAEAQELCSSWHAQAIKHRCHGLVVIHSNEGKEADDIARGWLGKQLRRKSESNLQVKRVENLVTLFGDTGQRRAPIPEHAGSTFRWDESVAMHVSAKPFVPPELEYLARQVFTGNQQQGFSELKRNIATTTGKSEETAKRRLKEMTDVGVITKNGAYYRLTDAA